MCVNTTTLDKITTFPTDIRHPDTEEWVRVVDYKRPHKHLAGVLAYVDLETGDYAGMILADDGPMDDPRRVETR